MDFMEWTVMVNVDTAFIKRYAITVMDLATMGVNLTLMEIDVIVSVDEYFQHGKL